MVDNLQEKYHHSAFVINLQNVMLYQMLYQDILSYKFSSLFPKRQTPV